MSCAAPPELPSEAGRLRALRSYDVLDTASESVFDELAALAARLAGCSMGLVTLVDANRQWFKAHVGLPLEETPRDQAFCRYALANPSTVLVVPDALQDPRFATNPLVTGFPHVRFYAGAPLVTPDGHVLGTLCVLDREPHALDEQQLRDLSSLAEAIMTTLELRRTRRLAQEQALTDPLTGLPNRRAFFDEVGRAIARQGRNSRPFGLIYLDLDGFKGVNDRQGHAAGDEVLREAARTLLAAVRRDDLVARLGGDEFALLLESGAAEAVGETVRHALHTTMEAHGWAVTASVGAVTFASPPASAAEATGAADQLMYAAKSAGKNRMLHRRVGRSAGGADAAGACTGLAMGELRTWFQPIVDLQSGRATGMEALARLVKDGRVIPPSVFLPDCPPECLRHLLFGVLDQGVAFLHRCRGSHPALCLSVNVDPVLLLESGFAAAVLARLDAARLDKGRIILEILESSEILDRDTACEQLRQLRDAGIRIALDDIGSGYSSLMRLRELPIDGIKLDQAFVRGISQRPRDLLFVHAVMSLAEGLGTSFVTEGVETPEILDALAVLGVGLAQGYAISRPMAPDTAAEWLAAHVPEPARRQPGSLLGVYASHLNVVRATEALVRQPLPVSWQPRSCDPHACLIGRFLDQHDLHGTPYGLAHKRFHQVLGDYGTDRDGWERAAEDFRNELEAAISAAA